MVKISLNIFSLLLISSIYTIAQNISAIASTDTTDYLVGDYINFTITVKYDKGIRISPPTLSDNLSNLELIKVLPVTSNAEDELNIQYFNYILTGYDSTNVIIPPIPITYFIGNNSEPQTINTNEVEILIHTLQVNSALDIKDIKAPIRIAFDWVFWSILFLIVLTVLFIAYLLYKKFFKPKTEVRQIRRTPALPDYIITLRALEELENKKLWQQGKVKEYHYEITGIIRQYFEKRYHFNSLEMTTDETIKVLNRVMDNQKMIDTAKNFLYSADMVKFAKFIPLPSVNEEMMKHAYEIVNKTKEEEHLISEGVEYAQ